MTAGIFNPTADLILEKLFYQLCNFLLAPVIFVFIFDGAGRPPVKRGTRVIIRESILIQRLKTMILNFGFHFYEVGAICYVYPRC